MLIVEWTKRAIRDMNQVGDRKMKQRIDEAITRFAATSHGNVKALQGRREEYRLRVGDWRVRFTIDDRGQLRVLIVQRVLPRGSAYER